MPISMTDHPCRQQIAIYKLGLGVLTWEPSVNQDHLEEAIIQGKNPKSIISHQYLRRCVNSSTYIDKG